MQDPESLEQMSDPNDGKYSYNGRFTDNPRVRGEWKMVGDGENLPLKKPGPPHSARSFF